MKEPPVRPPATIILLNGISSAGKTSIAQALQATMETPYLQVSIDAFENMLPERYDEGGLFVWPVLFPALLRGFHRSIAALAGEGHSLIVDHVMVHREGWMSTLADCLDVLEPFPVYFVGVRCALDEAERRERARGDRYRGTAARQFPLVHQHGLYDVEVDTTSTDPLTCAARIHTAITAYAPTAFARLRQLPRASIP
jgi:chloramphenicol 3-O phosphotransferase